MPPLRRYIRISPHSLLEVRIFLENPSDIPRWLLSPTSPALPHVFDAVRPLILPKLREERERTALTKGKGKKGKSVKDVVEGDGFRVVVFLTEGIGRHEVVVRRRTAREKGGRGGAGRSGGVGEPVVVRDEEEEEDDLVDLGRVPEVDDGDEDEVMEVGARERMQGGGHHREDKKKLGFETRYDGFSIWGKVLCLLVERKGGGVKKSASVADGGVGHEGAQKVMQEWISSTQVGAEDE